MSPDDLRMTIAFGRERRNTEFKGPGRRTDKAFLAKVVRAVLGLANTPDGGVVVIGVADDGSRLTPRGLSKTEAATWGYDDLHASLANYADPFVECEVAPVKLEDNTFVVIEVRAFSEFPVLCKKDFADTLRKGALYVRRRGKIETVEVPSHVEMREVIERAAEIRARAILASAARVGLTGEQPHLPSAAEHFAAEAQDLL